MAEQKQEKKEFHWADGVAEKLIKERPKSSYVCAARITPSGTIHIGNFREMITSDLVARALKDRGKKVKFIYGWDDYDRLRKIPANIPKQEEMQKYIGMPVSKVPDPFGCHKSYAEHFEKEVEQELGKVGVEPEFIYQTKMYESCRYAKEIRHVLQNRQIVIEILNKYKTEEKIGEDYWPLIVYCEKCGRDSTKILSYDNNFTIEYECECDYKGKVNFSKKGIVKLPWRIDWPMHWHYEQVDFEPGGKEHSTPGGSRTTGKEIFEALYKQQAPIYLMYDYIIIKGKGGKMSGSLGNVITLKECLSIYEPQILRYLFAATRPNTEFSIAFDMDVIKIYSEYDILEQRYFANNLEEKEKRIYELSQPYKIRQLFAIPFSQLSELAQVKTNEDIMKIFKEQIKSREDRERTESRILLARNWIAQMPDEIQIKLVDKVKKIKLNEKDKHAINQLIKFLKDNHSEDELQQGIYAIAKNNEIEPRAFFKILYNILLNKDYGPKLGDFISIIGQEKISKLLEQAL
ncbi:lysine--tRNA ligase [Candidatus Pacearchaeota archaeon]|nr:lysine--tRNA ligase [Candidatus Pacearchaeota archaeon]